MHATLAHHAQRIAYSRSVHLTGKIFPSTAIMRHGCAACAMGTRATSTAQLQVHITPPVATTAPPSNHCASHDRANRRGSHYTRHGKPHSGPPLPETHGFPARPLPRQAAIDAPALGDQRPRGNRGRWVRCLDSGCAATPPFLSDVPSSVRLSQQRRAPLRADSNGMNQEQLITSDLSPNEARCSPRLAFDVGLPGHVGSSEVSHAARWVKDAAARQLWSAAGSSKALITSS